MNVVTKRLNWSLSAKSGHPPEKPKSGFRMKEVGCAFEFFNQKAAVGRDKMNARQSRILITSFEFSFSDRPRQTWAPAACFRIRKRKPVIIGPKCPPCGSFPKAYKAPTPPLLMFGADEAACTAFIAAQGPHLGACKFCDLKGSPCRRDKRNVDEIFMRCIR